LSCKFSSPWFLMHASSMPQSVLFWERMNSLGFAFAHAFVFVARTISRYCHHWYRAVYLCFCCLAFRAPFESVLLLNFRLRCHDIAAIEVRVRAFDSCVTVARSLFAFHCLFRCVGRRWLSSTDCLCHDPGCLPGACR